MRIRRVALCITSAILMAVGAAQADLNIARNATANVSCSGGVCTSTAKNATLNVSDLRKMLSAGDVTVKARAAAINIDVQDGLSWIHGSRLTLDATQSVRIEKPVSVTGAGALTIVTNDGGTGGDLMFDGKGNVTFWDTSSSLVINGNSYTLVSNIRTLAKDIAVTPSGYYALANNYDASSDGLYRNSPIATLFKGAFEGLGNIISNLNIHHSKGNVGLFSELLAGTLRDVSLINANVTGSGLRSIFNLGGLVGQVESGMVVGVFVSGNLSASEARLGGIAGMNGGTVLRCRSAAVITGDSVGGLVGENTGIISQSSATGNVSTDLSGSTSIGGLVDVNTGTITQSYSTGKVTSSDDTLVAGGLVSSNGGTITLSYSHSAVVGGAEYAGGLAGVSGEKNATISQSFADGPVRTPNA